MAFQGCWHSSLWRRWILRRITRARDRRQLESESERQDKDPLVDSGAVQIALAVTAVIFLLCDIEETKDFIWIIDIAFGLSAVVAILLYATYLSELKVRQRFAPDRRKVEFYHTVLMILLAVVYALVMMVPIRDIWAGVFNNYIDYFKEWFN